MAAESTTITASRFIYDWNTKNTDPSRLVEELFSLANETNRRPDTYVFNAEDGLIDPATGKSIFEFIQPGLEYRVAENLQKWAMENDEGLAFWISPKLAGVYPCNKIIIHQIAYTLAGEKVVLNSAILFDGDIENPEEVRGVLVEEEDNDENLQNILLWIKQFTDEDVGFREMDDDARELAEYFARKIKEGVEPRVVVEEMKKIGFLGEHAVSCPPSARASRKKAPEGAIIVCCKCPVCHRQVEAYVINGRIYCPDCGASNVWFG